MTTLKSSQSFNIPKFLLGETSPLDETRWVIRSRSPFLVVRIDPNWHFSCWPKTAEEECSADRLYKLVGKLAEFQGKELKTGSLPSSWNYDFKMDSYPPSHLLVRGSGITGFKGVLRLSYPKAFFLPSDRGVFAAVIWIDEVDPAKAELITEESLRWYAPHAR